MKIEQAKTNTLITQDIKAMKNEFNCTKSHLNEVDFKTTKEINNINAEIKQIKRTYCKGCKKWPWV